MARPARWTSSPPTDAERRMATQGTAAYIADGHDRAAGGHGARHARRSSGRTSTWAPRGPGPGRRGRRDRSPGSDSADRLRGPVHRPDCANGIRGRGLGDARCGRCRPGCRPPTCWWPCERRPIDEAMGGGGWRSLGLLAATRAARAATTTCGSTPDFDDPGDCIVVDLSVSLREDRPDDRAGPGLQRAPTRPRSTTAASSPARRARPRARPPRCWPRAGTRSVEGPRPVIWSPASSAWGAILNQRLADDGEPADGPRRASRSC